MRCRRSFLAHSSERPWTSSSGPPPPGRFPPTSAVCLNPELPYAAVEAKDELLVLAEGLYKSVMKTLGIEDYSVVASFDADL